MADFNIRLAVESDCDEIVRLRQELADYNKISDKMEMTAEKLRRDGFGDRKCFQCLVVEDMIASASKDNAVLLGYALYFYTYSAKVGRVLFLEDIFVSAAHRGRGIGSKLFQDVAQVGVAQGCQRMQWEAYAWNKPSIAFYKKRGAKNITDSESLHWFEINGPKLEQLAKQSFPAHLNRDVIADNR
ncbi:thialysine N-epsilon-acetyltransferase-like [Ylistrum balloti]|uniref:thialysine N-epsilon-acetyltransferase-like n=1 Tax=Ylistrum balloti TaxID=509963 RepID=UPI002905B04F|nr:thialysine N-epsilon-acetyltransferase-like [Ylistrum balloti]